MKPASIIKSLRKGELTRDEANRLMSKIMDPKDNPLPPRYEIKGHRVTKERYDEWMRHNG